MKLGRGLALYFLGLFTAFGCASVFPFRHYNVQMPADCYAQGQLLGKLGNEGWPDLKLTTCEPDPDPVPGASPGPMPIKMKCATMLLADFNALKDDDMKCQSDLAACQHGFR